MLIDPTKGEKTHPFSDKEIKPIAEEISRSDENRGNDRENWEAAIQQLKNQYPIQYFLWERKNNTCILVTKPLHLFYNSKNRDFTLDIIKTLVSFSSLVATFIAAFSLISSYNHNNERLITDRFSKAVEQLGSRKLEVRIGAIYALERISKDSDKDYWTVIEVLTAFLRERSNLNTENTQEVSEPKIDIQAVITVLKRRSKSYGNGEKEGLNLYQAKLQGASLGGANFQKASLGVANLQQAFLWEANLQQAFLVGANLQKAFLAKANLQKANLGRANLQQADLEKANLQKANLVGAKNLTHQQIKSACFWEKAIYKSGDKENQKFIKKLKQDKKTDPK
ncbi:pentapeptide repeat-containing protein [Calothrix rhizosoleniae]|uniref:pentapeptide repeat-containing protein n=1 Tax=Calothrix rhizosoleniae TaxID=888997 RepID=UPI000B49B0C3|nr:pentapeptide repeat-containing protein [Calothrix rhizosoleniae]